jgi:glycosyltransferase involved in cell wall biosynthesis
MEKIRNEICRELDRDSSFNNIFNYLMGKISNWIPCITDEFSSLRYSLFLIKKCCDSVGKTPFIQSDNPLLQALLLETYYSFQLKTTEQAKKLLSHSKDTIERIAILSALSTKHIKVSPLDLLELIGHSHYIDSLIRDIFRAQLKNWDRGELKAYFHEKLSDIKISQEKFTALLDIATEHNINVLTERVIETVFKHQQYETHLLLALLRHIGECNLYDIFPMLLRKIIDREELPAIIWLRSIDVITQLSDENIFKEFKTSFSQSFQRIMGTLFHEYLALAERTITNSSQSSDKCQRKGLILVQCAFYGAIEKHGEAGGGGLATLLNTLGRSMGNNDESEWERIYTLVFYHQNGKESDRHLIERSGSDKHFILRVPVSFPAVDQSNQFLIHEYEVLRSVQRTLELYKIDPDIFHIRYSDNASKSVMLLANKLHKKLVFTLTPDPHRALTDEKGAILIMSEEDALMYLNKVLITDQLIHNADGLVLIGHEEKNDQIIPYFPALWLDNEIKEKPIRILPEGINMRVQLRRNESGLTYIKLLTEHSGQYRLKQDFLHNPLILNVGRLHETKGQHILVEAWLESGLYHKYNLVLVGGNLNNPDKTEKSIISHIDRLLQYSGSPKERFCHIGAMTNRNVRLFENSIMEEINTETPHVYLCSSRKEEFGISILEAMSAGFLIVAPKKGGVSTYIQNENNGFLINTHDVPSIRRGMESILNSDIFSSETLNEIARRGMSFAHQTFSIEKIAEEFKDFYTRVLFHKE